MSIEEVDTNLTDKAQIQRLIDDIDLMDTKTYTDKSIVPELEFRDINGDICYLEVDELKPIDKLASIFEESKKQNLSDKGLSILDMILSESDTKQNKEKESDVSKISEIVVPKICDEYKELKMNSYLFR